MAKQCLADPDVTLLHEYQLDQLSDRVKDTEESLSSIVEWKGSLASSVTALEKTTQTLIDKLDNLSNRRNAWVTHLFNTLTTVAITLIVSYIWYKIVGGK